jgi:hypothetical protein
MTAAAAVAPGSPHPCTSRSQGLCCLAGTRRFKPTSFTAPQAQRQEPAATHTSEPQMPHFTVLRCQEASLPTEHGGPALTTKPSHRSVPTIPSKSGNPSPPLSGNLPLCGCQETCFPKAQKAPVLPTVPDQRKAPASPLKSKNIRFPTEESIAVTCYSVGDTRRPSSSR